MWVVFFWAGVGVALIVYGLIAWCIVRYRRRPGDDAYPPQFKQHKTMEIVYTAIPLLMVAGLFAITYPAERHVETIAGREAVVVNVTGFRWSWRFAYPNYGVAITGSPQAPPTFEIPVGQTTRFNVTSVDVDHSFWVPEFLFKRDAITGLVNIFDWTPTQLGNFRGECGEFCGLDHADMSFVLKVVPPGEFAKWIASQRRLALYSPATHR